jgi:hypothetical protein
VACIFEGITNEHRGDRKQTKQRELVHDRRAG